MLLHRLFPSLDFLPEKINRSNPPPPKKKKEKEKERLDFPLWNEANINDSYRGREIKLGLNFEGRRLMHWNVYATTPLYGSELDKSYEFDGSTSRDAFPTIYFTPRSYFQIYCSAYIHIFTFHSKWDIGVEIQNAEVLCPRIPLLNNENQALIAKNRFVKIS